MLPSYPSFIVSAVVVAGLSLTPSVQAHGGFPDAAQLLLPVDNDEVVLSTDFGVLRSNDGGKTWEFSCSDNLTQNVGVYQLGLPPDERLFAVSLSSGLAYFDQQECRWQSGGGVLGAVTASDVLLHPRDASLVYAVGVPLRAGGVDGFYHSSDGGVTFDGPRFEVRTDEFVSGVELAPSMPSLLYMATALLREDVDGVKQPAPHLNRSLDGGQSWQTPIDLSGQLGSHSIRIIAVDKNDPERLFLRVFEQDRNSLALSVDGGQTFERVLTVDGRLSAFAQLDAGTLLVAALTDDVGQGFRSSDGGRTFEPWSAPSITGLGERDGVLYVAADFVLDGYILGTSVDEGQTIVPVSDFSDVTHMAECYAERCRNSCQQLAMQGFWDDRTCGIDVEAPPSDSSGGTDAGASPGNLEPEEAGGCSLSDSNSGAGLSAWALLSVLAVLLLRRSSTMPRAVAVWTESAKMDRAH